MHATAIEFGHHTTINQSATLMKRGEIKTPELTTHVSGIHLIGKPVWVDFNLALAVGLVQGHMMPGDVLPFLLVVISINQYGVGGPQACWNQPLPGLAPDTAVHHISTIRPKS